MLRTNKNIWELTKERQKTTSYEECMWRKVKSSGKVRVLKVIKAKIRQKEEIDVDLDEEKVEN